MPVTGEVGDGRSGVRDIGMGRGLEFPRFGELDILRRIPSFLPLFFSPEEKESRA